MYDSISVRFYPVKHCLVANNFPASCPVFIRIPHIAVSFYILNFPRQPYNIYKLFTPILLFSKMPKSERVRERCLMPCKQQWSYSRQEQVKKKNKFDIHQIHQSKRWSLGPTQDRSWSTAFKMAKLISDMYRGLLCHIGERQKSGSGTISQADFCRILPFLGYCTCPNHRYTCTLGVFTYWCISAIPACRLAQF